ncbi:hypothetical protein Ancab_004157, partial [Ancistrocladus abbreviatus]
ERGRFPPLCGRQKVMENAPRGNGDRGREENLNFCSNGKEAKQFHDANDAQGIDILI